MSSVNASIIFCIFQCMTSLVSSGVCLTTNVKLPNLVIIFLVSERSRASKSILVPSLRADKLRNRKCVSFLCWSTLLFWTTFLREELDNVRRVHSPQCGHAKNWSFMSRSVLVTEWKDSSSEDCPSFWSFLRKWLYLEKAVRFCFSHLACDLARLLSFIMQAL